MRTLIFAGLLAASLTPPVLEACELLSEKPASLSGRADDSQFWQNKYADEDGLDRIASAAHRKRFIDSGLLVPVPSGKCLASKAGVKWARPYVLRFLEDFAGFMCNSAGGIPVQVNSALRTVEEQRILSRKNANAGLRKVSCGIFRSYTDKSA